MRFKHVLSTLGLSFFGLNVVAQITVTGGQTVNQLVQNILTGPSLEATNITFQGNAAQANVAQNGVQFFEVAPGTNFPFPSGIILGTSGAPSVNGDPDLNALGLANVTNGSIIEFDFVATGDTMNFKYVFASVEYPTYVCSNFNDVFGFFLSGPGITGPFTNNAANIALIPGTNTPVAINTVNSGMAGGAGSPGTCFTANPLWIDHSVYFTTEYNDIISAALGFENYGGATVALIAASGLICNETYKIKMGVANALDQGLNSVVFLEAESFQVFGYEIVVQPNIEGPTQNGLFAEGCTNATLMVTRVPDTLIVDTICVPVLTAGTLDPATDLLDFPTEICFPPGVDTVYFEFNPIQDNITEGIEELTITLMSVNACGVQVPTEVTLSVIDFYEFTFDLTPDQTINCLTASIQGEVTNIQGGAEPYTYLWEPNGETTSSITLSPGVNQEESIMFVVTVTDFCGFAVSDSLLLTIEPSNFTFDLTPDQTINCNIESIEAQVTNLQGGAEPYTFSWLPNGETTATINMTPGVNNEPITYIVTVTDFCGITLSDTVVLSVAPNDFTFDLTPDQTVQCLTTTVNASVTNIQGGFGPFTYSWTPNGENTSTITMSPGANTQDVIVYTVTVTDVCGHTEIDTVVLTVNETLEIDPSSEPTLCGLETGQILFNVSGQTGAVQYELTGPGTSLTVNQNQQNNLPSGWFYITATDGVCSTQDSVFIGLLDGPTAVIGANPVAGFSPLVSIFGNGSQNADSYFWDFGNGETIQTTSSENQIMIFEGEGPLDINVCLIAIQPGCQDTACVVITIFEYIPPPVFTIPNVFSPNGDGNNDTWNFFNLGFVETIELTILNRWGNVVFESTDPNPTWNGKLQNGNDAAEGVYFYKYLLTGKDKITTHEGHGYLQLIRE